MESDTLVAEYPCVWTAAEPSDATVLDELKQCLWHVKIHLLEVRIMKLAAKSKSLDKRVHLELATFVQQNPGSKPWDHIDQRVRDFLVSKGVEAPAQGIECPVAAE